MGGDDKRVSFEDGHSSASDEDAKAVEVTIEFSGIVSHYTD